MLDRCYGRDTDLGVLVVLVVFVGFGVGLQETTGGLYMDHQPGNLGYAAGGSCVITM